MRVKCINDGLSFLTVNEIYNVIDEDAGYKIINNIGSNWIIPKEWFKPFYEIRKEKIDKLLEDDITYVI
jgi:hypothetical protein